MALTGSQKAYLQARSGIARSGAIRSGYYTFSVIVLMRFPGIADPVDITAHVVYNGWAISMNINDEIDTATIQLLPSLPYAPVTRSQITIGFGSADNVQFSGLVMTIQRTRRPGPDPRFWYDLTCVDWLTVFDAHFVLADYPAQSVTTTILDIVTRFTRGAFTTDGVAPGMPVVDGFQVVNERPSTVLRRLTGLVGGGFYIDAGRRVRAWSASVPSPIQESVPQALTDELTSLKTFRVTEDASQQRTRVFVEGRRTSTALGVPTGPGASVAIPVTEDHVVRAGTAGTPEKLTRVGTQIGQAFYVFQATATAAENPAGTVTTADAAAGAAALDVADNAAFAAFAPDGGWALIAGQYVICTPGTGVSNLLYLSAGTAYGALQAPVAAGTQIVPIPWMQFEPQDRRATPTGPLFTPGPMRVQPDETPVVLVARADAAAAAAVLAGREGSDGFYEHLVQDGRYTDAGARARAEAELADFTDAIVMYDWETDDLNAEPGRLQHIGLVQRENRQPVTDDVRITNVAIRPIAAKALPMRSVRAARVRPASVMDVWLDDPR